MENFTPISLDPVAAETTAPISLDTTNDTNITSPEVASSRTFKTMFGINPKGETFETVYQNFIAGRERDMRASLAAQVDQEKKRMVEANLLRLAQEQQRPLMQADVDALYAAANASPSDPKSVIEEQYAKKVMEELKNNRNSSFYQTVSALAPRETEMVLDVGKNAIAYREYAQKHYDNSSRQISEQSILGWGFDQAKLLSQVYTELKLRGLVDNVSFFSGFLGTNLDEQAKALFRLPFEEFKLKFDAIMEKLNRDNPSAARQFASAVVGLSSDEKLISDIMTPAMLTFVGTLSRIGKSVKETKEASKIISKATNDMVQHTAAQPATKEVIQEAAGDLKSAAISQEAETVTKIMRGTVDPREEARRALPLVLDGAADDIKKGPGNFRQEFVNRLVETYNTTKNNLMDAINTIAQVERLPNLLKVEAALKAITQKMERDFGGIDNTVIKVSAPTKEISTGLWNVDVYLGKGNAEFFGSEAAAVKFAQNHGIKGAIVEQQGFGWSIRVTTNIKETDQVLRDVVLYTNETKTPDSIFNAMGGWLGSARTAEDTLSFEQNIQRKIAAYTPSVLSKILRESSEDIVKLKGWSIGKGKRYKDWEDVVREAVKAKDADGKPYLYKSPQEFSHAFNTQKGYLPDEQQVAAWFAYKRGTELEEFLLKREKYKSNAREGAKMHTVSAIDKEKEAAKSIGSDRRKVVAEKVNELSPGNDSVLIMGDWKGAERFVSTDDLRRLKSGKELLETIKKGDKVLLRIINPEENPFAGFGKVTDVDRPRYVIANRAMVDSTELSWDDVKINRPATYDYTHYVKQARIRQDPTTKHNWYEGDTTVAGFNIPTMGRHAVEQLNKVRELIKQNKFAKAAAENPFEDWEMVLKWFRPQQTADGKMVAPLLNLDQEIVLVPKHKKIVDMGPGLKDRINATAPDSFRDGTREGYGKHLEGPVDANEILGVRNIGTAADPLYQIEPSKIISPVESLNRGLKRAVDTAFMNDYKIFSIEHWIKEAEKAGVLKTNQKELWEAPYHYFYNPDYAPGADKIKVNNLETARFQIQQFMGVPDEMTTFLHSWAQRMADNLYAKGYSKAALVPEHVLPALRDPFSFIRGATFHAKIGLFSIPQLMIQANTFTQIMGIAGHTYAVPGAKASLLHFYSRINRNPEILDHLDKLASNFRLIPGTSRWRPGEFKEAHALMGRTGFGNVAGEYILRDNPMAFDIIPGTGTRFLDASSFFFREGEKSVRYAAFYTAYREFRDKVATGAITDAQLREILNRADLLSINMSRASASMLHKGFASIPMQFVSYQLRLAELFFSKRISNVDRARMLAWNAALYGVPTSIGVAGLPAGDWMQKKAREHGYVVGDNAITSTFMEGIPALLGALATGGGNQRKGNWYNINEAYGPSGLFGDLLRTDPSILDFLGGASYSTLSNTVAHYQPFLQAILSGIRDDGEHFPLKHEDWVAGFSEISSVDKTKRLIYAINYGRWVSKNEANLGPITKTNAIFQYLSGLQSTDLQDANLMLWTRKAEKEMANEGMKLFIKEYRRAMNSNNDPQQFQDYMKRAFRYLRSHGVPEEEFGKMFSVAGKGYAPMIEEISRKFYTDGVPKYRRGAAFEAQERYLKLKQEQGK